jgi:antitoxin (DNA-binding transcriptional repressor) of toxin-antitoxin stability system
MKTIKLASASRSLAEYAKELDDQIVIITERNKPVAAVVPLKNVDRESLALSSHPEFMEIIKTLSLEEMKKAVLPRRTANKRMERTRKTRRSS